MTITHEIDGEMGRLWNGAGGQAWVAAQGVLDRMFEPIADLLVEAVPFGSRARVLDIGCGAGSTTLAVARRLGANGSATGVDISGPMITAARTRAERECLPVRFIRADAQRHAFEPARFDAIISRFGVMFFDDSVEAFANLRRAAAGDAELRIVAWRSAEENPFMTAAERAAAPLLPDLPERRPDEPGQFAFADGQRVHSILHESGWAEIDIRPMDVACTLPEAELVPYLSHLGPVGRALQDVDDRTRRHVIETVRAAMEPFVYGDEVRYSAACWVVRARAGRPPEEAAASPVEV